MLNFQICSTDSSHCSIHSTASDVFSTTDVWNFSLPRPIVTKGSLVPFFPLIFSPLARFTENSQNYWCWITVLWISRNLTLVHELGSTSWLALMITMTNAPFLSFQQTTCKYWKYITSSSKNSDVTQKSMWTLYSLPLNDTDQKPYKTIWPLILCEYRIKV